jgi:tetratricopeptide (TPR) repeat protein
MSGHDLTPDQVREMEAALEKKPDDLSARTKLLGYYFTRRASDPASAAAQQKHVVWIIKNRPDAAIAGTPFCSVIRTDKEKVAEATDLWLKQIKAHPGDIPVLANAANFFLHGDPDKAEELYRQLEATEPKNPKWHDSLGRLYSLRKNGGAAAATLALKEYEQAQALDTDDSSKFYRLDQLAMQACNADQLDKASQYGEELLAMAAKLPKDWNYGNAIHHGNIVLGRVALKRGDTAKAIDCLLNAGKTHGSPQLNSFGPNMTLARDLLAKGEKDAVLQYFDLCRKFWAMGGEQLDVWAKQVEAGKTPEFGSNLAY